MCSGETYVWEYNMGSDHEPDVGIWAVCLDPDDTDCGFHVRHSEIVDGEETQVLGDWAITSTQMAAYHQAHLDYIAKAA
jgi:hypothetical protein